MGLKTFSDIGPRPLLWTGSRVARGNITVSGISIRLNYCVIFYTMYIIFKCGRELHNTAWRAADWRPTCYNVFFKLLAPITA